MPSPGASPAGPRFSDASSDKRTGSTYTPPELARFLAQAVVQAAQWPEHGPIRVLDPAVGDGALLEALLASMPPSLLPRVEVTGLDIDPEAIQASQKRLSRWPVRALAILREDFLGWLLSQGRSADLLSSPAHAPFDAVIANPPYVRTQVMGAQATRQLAQRFGLSGRVDLYYAFLLGISQVLAPAGVASVVTSNRFMTTQSGRSLRAAMRQAFDLQHIWDLGDTKLFDAAVLPAVILARPAAGAATRQSPRFTVVYETASAATQRHAHVLHAVADAEPGIVELPDGRRFEVQHGHLAQGEAPDAVWRMATQDIEQWLERVAQHTWQPFSHIGKIRVGIKSTADKIFVRSDWHLQAEGRPELLRPLVTRHVAGRFRPSPAQGAKARKEVLYPHESGPSGRRAVDLSRYPVSRRYLQRHQAQLASRQYLIDAGRQWYELWVPQDPAAWSEPKVVFVDIAERPTFWMDTSGGVVNGECYWLKADDPAKQALLWLALAVANSRFIEAFYDRRFNNKLYAGRRRFITQYVEQFPLPDPSLPNSQALIRLAQALSQGPDEHAKLELERELERRVWSAFGLGAEEVGG